MNLLEIEKERLRIDSELEGFSDFIEIKSFQEFKIVHRDAKNWKGIIDNMDNVILPLVYDNIEVVNYGIRLTICGANGQSFVGLANAEDMHIVIPVCFKALCPFDDIEKIWCLDAEGIWGLYNLDGQQQVRLPSDYKPLSTSSDICVLHKNDCGDYSVECWNEKIENSQRLLRTIALGSELPGRIVLNSYYYHVVVYCDLYGRVLYSNLNLDNIFEKQ